MCRRRLIEDLPEACRFQVDDSAAAWARLVAFMYGPSKSSLLSFTTVRGDGTDPDATAAGNYLEPLAAALGFAAKWDAGELRMRCVAALEALPVTAEIHVSLAELASEHSLVQLADRCAEFAKRAEREAAAAAAAAEAGPAFWHQPLFACFATPMQSAR